MTKELKPDSVSQLVRAIQQYRELHPQVEAAERALAAQKPRHGDVFNEVNGTAQRARQELEQNVAELDRLTKEIAQNMATIEHALKLITTLRAVVR